MKLKHAAGCLYITFTLLIVQVPQSFAHDSHHGLTPLFNIGWNLGQWWVVRSKVYDLDYAPEQTWKFMVAGQDVIDEDAFYIVNITPIDGNPSHYWFRFWFRQSDLLAVRYERYDLDGDTVTPDINNHPKVVYNIYSKQGYRLFWNREFKIFPIIFPVYDLLEFTPIDPGPDRTIIAGRTVLPGPPGLPSKNSRQPDQNPLSGLVAKRALKVSPDHIRKVAKLKNESLFKQLFQDINLEIIVKTDTDDEMSQIWNRNMPWYVYGQLSKEGVPRQKYWLVEFGSRPVSQHLLE